MIATHVMWIERLTRPRVPMWTSSGPVVRGVKAYSPGVKAVVPQLGQRQYGVAVRAGEFGSWGIGTRGTIPTVFWRWDTGFWGTMRPSPWRSCGSDCAESQTPRARSTSGSPWTTG
jgi:hypothetical protein